MPEGHLPLRSYLAAPVKTGRGEVLGGLFFGHPEAARFGEAEEQLVVGIAAHAAVAIDNARLYQSSESARRHLAILAEAGRLIASSLDVDEILESLAAAVVPAVADTCVVFLVGEDGRAYRATERLDPAVGDALTDVHLFGPDLSSDDHPVARAMRTRQALLVAAMPEAVIDADVTARDREVEGRLSPVSAIVAPLVRRDEALGAIAITTSVSGRTFGRDDLALAEQLARRCAVAVENSRLYASQRTTAEILQRSLLPDRLPDLPGIHTAACYRPGGPNVEVGGDWYDVLALGDGTLLLAMGDVVGRGVPAASLMGQLRNALRAYAFDGHAGPAIAGKLNDLLCDHDAGSRFATLVIAIFDPETGVLRVTNAGHPPPLVVNGDGSASFLTEGTAPPIGAIPGATFVEDVVAVAADAMIILYTDGLVEDRATPLDQGLERLRTVASEGTHEPDALRDHIIERCLEGRAADDDVAVVVMHHLPVPARLTLDLPTEARILRPLRATLRRWLAAGGVGEPEAFEVLVAAGEACSNAIRYGSRDSRTFELEGEIADDVRVCVRSQSEWRSARDGHGNGGRGHSMIEELMDEVDVVRDGPFTEVRMRRALRQPVGR